MNMMRKLLPLVLLAQVLVTGAALAGTNTWTGHGPHVPVHSLRGIHALAISPAGGRIYAGSGLNTVYAFGDASLSEPPSASDDSVVVNAGGPTDINVLANDTDPEHALDPASIEIAAAPAHGTAAATTGGSVAYTPDAGFAGTDQFTYTVADAAGNVSNPSTVEIEVNALPLAGDLNLTVTAGERASGVLPGGDPEGEPVTFAITAPPAHGHAAITDAATGAFTYTSTSAAGFAGDDSFAYTTNDGRADSLPGIVRVTVEGADAPPADDGGNSPPPGNGGNAAPPASSGGGGGGWGLIGGLLMLGVLALKRRLFEAPFRAP